MTKRQGNGVRPSRETIGERMTQHGHAVRPYSPTYRSWLMMRARCRCVDTPMYQKYGARGITVCDRWDDFSLFLEDMNERPSLSYSLDRIDGGRGYEPSNCRWATKSEQALNRCSTRPVICSDGRQFSSLKEAADAVGGSRSCIWDACNGNQRTHRGFSWRYAT